MPLAIFGHDVKMAAAGISFFYLTYWRLSKEGISRGYTFLALLIPPLAVFLPLYLIYFSQMRTSFPSSLFHIVGVIAGYLARQRTPVVRANFQVHFIVICVTACTWGFDYWLHKINFQSWTGVTSVKAPDFVFKTELGGRVTRDSIREKIVVLDFWTTNCGACFESFPKLQEMSGRLKNNSDVVIYAVNVPIKTDLANEALEMLRTRGYSFSLIFADSSNVNLQFNFNSYPTVFVLQGSSIVYKGSLGNLLDNHSGLIGL